MDLAVSNFASISFIHNSIIEPKYRGRAEMQFIGGKFLLSVRAKLILKMIS